MGFEELFGKSSPGAQKDEITNANIRPKINNSSILGAAGQAFNQAKSDFSEITESPDPSDTSENLSDSDETESSDSSITRVEQDKNKVKTGLNLENPEVDKGARAKVSANMIISDFSNLQQSKHHQEQYENSSLTSPTAWVETSNESGRNNVLRRPRVKASTISEGNFSFQYKKSNIVNQPRKVSFDSNSDATLKSEQTYARSDTRSDVSWGSDPGKSLNNSNNQISPRQPKVRTTNSDFSSYLSQYQNDNYVHNVQQYNSTSSNNQKSWSDVTYGGPIESSTVVSHYSDPGPRKKISVSAQMNVNNDIEDYEEENAVEFDQELDELINMSSNPKIQRKFLDLKIANKSLLTLNNTLEETIKKQSSNLNTYESMSDVQQLQLDHITKVEELMRELSIKISSQELEIRNLKNKLDDNSEQQQKSTRVSLFYDPRNLPMNTLPNIIFDRVYEDIVILFSVVVSLIYTIYILPIIVTAKTAKLLADKSRTKILEITG
ncbi:hypothetical protein GLOIN_2v1476069 [Rhizophagus clarus]|uniref:Uncharacterized protein n=1 Tax=Rhizophagus clarus TaxID=94130 RepID=A0A8H3KZZ1_9GLOM|nr:hypothetical protein GLOIN_2v1476069 [Rhizophagus clarus]